jgi:hypothetical protein
MRRAIFFGLLVAAAGVGMWFLMRHSPEHTPEAAREGTVHSGDASTASALPRVQGTNNAAEKSFATLASRKQMSDAERLRWLERLGRAPADADWKDIYLAGRTSWWGQRLDPQKFWKGRVIWCDDSARGDAAAHGRAWPPIPYDEATLARLYPALARAYPTEGRTVWSQPGPDTPPISKGSAMTDREAAFWTEFSFFSLTSG